jgi:endoglucanase Acf2
MSSRRPNERSPLLQGNGRSSAANAGEVRDSSVLSRLSRARYVLIPMLLVAIVGILWMFSSDPNSHAYRVKHLRAPMVNSSAFSDAELLTLAPPFDVAGHPIPPRMLNRSAFANRAIPTNQFWTNLLIGDDHGLNLGSGPVTLSPFTVRCLPKRVDISYGDSRRVVMSENITEYFNADVAFTAYKSASKSGGLLGDGNATSREVVAFDALSATVQYRFDNASESGDAPTQWMNALLVRGSPYVTVEYENLVPVLEFNATVYAINNVPVQEIAEPVTATARQQWTAARFEIDVGVYGATQALVRQKWIVYFATHRTLQLQLANEKDYRSYNLRGELTTPTNIRLVDSEAYTGAARLAIVPVVGQNDTIATLDKYASVYPIATSVGTSVVDASALVTLGWSGKTLAGVETTDSPMLLLANPHHVASFSKTRQQDKAFQVLSPGFGHRTVKSYMTPVIGNSWVLEETLEDIGFYGPASQIDTLKTKPKVVDAIVTAVRNDSTYEPEAQDPYYFGKEIARQARLVLISDLLESDNKTREALLDKLEDWVGPWLVGTNDDQFVYDQDWGGLCSLNGLKGVFWMTDFGNGWYNDHVRLSLFVSTSVGFS